MPSSYFHNRSNVLKALSKDDLVAMILAQQVQIEVQAVQIVASTARITELEARLNMPPKTPGNSSTPLSKGQKPNRPERPKNPCRGRRGVTRALAVYPDRVIEATLDACPHGWRPRGGTPPPRLARHPERQRRPRPGQCSFCPRSVFGQRCKPSVSHYVQRSKPSLMVKCSVSG